MSSSSAEVNSPSVAYAPRRSNASPTPASAAKHDDDVAVAEEDERAPVALPHCAGRNRQGEQTQRNPEHQGKEPRARHAGVSKWQQGRLPDEKHADDKQRRCHREFTITRRNRAHQGIPPS